MSETKQRPTPETDAQAFCRSKAKGWVAPGKEAVAADFARRLERERDEARERADKAEAMVRRFHRCLVTGGYGSDEYAHIMEAIEAGEGEG